MVQNDEKPASPRRKRKGKPVMHKSVKVSPSVEESFLVCEDCRHNSIRYDPVKDGACDCGCH